MYNVCPSFCALTQSVCLWDPTTHHRRNKPTRIIALFQNSERSHPQDDNVLYSLVFSNSCSTKAIATNNNRSDPSALISFGLGLVLAGGTALTLLTDNYADLGLYLCTASSGHLLNYIYAMTFHPMYCTSDSFLLFPNSKESMLLLFSFFEYFSQKALIGWTYTRDLIPRVWLFSCIYLPLVVACERKSKTLRTCFNCDGTLPVGENSGDVDCRM